MVDILKRELAPITNRAWEELDKEAARLLKQRLVGRKLVDVSGPHGWALGSVNLGRLESTEESTPEGVGWGLRRNLPLVEVRVPFALGQMELDDVDRGCADADLGPLQAAALKAASFEDAAVLQGFDKAPLPGILASSEQDPVALPAEAGGYPDAAVDAVGALVRAGIGGPYAMVLAPGPYADLMKAGRGTGYPPHRAVRDVLGGEVLISPVLDGGLVVSVRGGDFELTVGADYSLGWAAHDREKVELFIAESFAFRVLEPRAAVPLEAPGR